MKRQKQMQKAFGINEFGQPDLPAKISNVQISRITYGAERGCSRCFPHGFETNNSTIVKRQRNWKRFRRTRWKRPKKKGRSAPAFFFASSVIVIPIGSFTLIFARAVFVFAPRSIGLIIKFQLCGIIHPTSAKYIKYHYCEKLLNLLRVFESTDIDTPNKFS